MSHTQLYRITSSEMCSLHLIHPSAQHTWSSGQPTLRRPGSSWGFGALLKGLTSVVNNSLPEPRFEPTTSGYKSDALSIRAMTVTAIWSGQMWHLYISMVLTTETNAGFKVCEVRGIDSLK